MEEGLKSKIGFLNGKLFPGDLSWKSSALRFQPRKAFDGRGKNKPKKFTIVFLK